LANQFFMGMNPYRPLTGSHQSLACVTSTALTVPSVAALAIITVTGGSIRWRDDGTAPTASVGHLSLENSTLVIPGEPQLRAFRFIEVDATNPAKVEVSYYKVL